LTVLMQADEVAVLPAGHPLLGRRRLKPKDFAGQPFVSFAPTDPYRQQVDALFDGAGVRRVLAIDTTSAVSVCALVRQGLGLGIVNPLTALEWAGDTLHARPLSVHIPFHVALVLPQVRAPNPLRDAFVVALREAAADLGKRLKRLY
jgi:DNA-binding transcriptional LysR family regulator